MDFCCHCSQKVNDTLLCGSCKHAVYCSAACQLAAWDGGHNQFCRATTDEPARAVKEASQMVLPEPRMVTGWACEYGCEFTGAFDIVREHEKGCQKNPASKPLETANQTSSAPAVVAAPVAPPRRSKLFHNSGSLSIHSSPSSIANAVPCAPNTSTPGGVDTGSQIDKPYHEWPDPSSTGNTFFSFSMHSVSHRVCVLFYELNIRAHTYINIYLPTREHTHKCVYMSKYTRAELETIWLYST